LNIDQSEDNPRNDDLICNELVNFGLYDNLKGIRNGASHHSTFEVEKMVELFRDEFGKWSTGSVIDVNTVGQRLRASKLKKSDHYTWRGNYWRMIGDTLQAIQCFRKALEVSPRNSNVLLYLGRILFKLEYFDDAIFATKKSLKFREVGSNGWKQHFQLGEMEVATDNLKEAVHILRRAHRLRPDHEPLAKMVRDIEIRVFCKVNLGPQTDLALIVFSFVLWELINRNRQLFSFFFTLAICILVKGEIKSIKTCIENIDDWTVLIN